MAGPRGGWCPARGFLVPPWPPALRVEGRRGPRRWLRWQDHVLVAMESWDPQTLSPVGGPVDRFGLLCGWFPGTSRLTSALSADGEAV